MRPAPAIQLPRPRTWPDQHALALLQPHWDEARRALAERLPGLVRTSHATAELPELLAAAQEGRIHQLLVSRQATRWGRFDPHTHALELHAEPHRGDDELLDVAAAETFLHGGAVTLVEADEMPLAAPAVAVLRHPRRSGAASLRGETVE